MKNGKTRPVAHPRTSAWVCTTAIALVALALTACAPMTPAERAAWDADAPARAARWNAILDAAAKASSDINKAKIRPTVFCSAVTNNCSGFPQQ